MRYFDSGPIFHVARQRAMRALNAKLANNVFLFFNAVMTFYLLLYMFLKAKSDMEDFF